MKGAGLVKTWIVVTCLMLFTSAAALAQTDYCEGNFDYDSDQDGGDAFTFKEDFGPGFNSTINLQRDIRDIGPENLPHGEVFVIDWLEFKDLRFQKMGKAAILFL